MGYFPVPTPALESILTRIVPAGGETAMLDPCAGEGVATKVIQQHLSLREKDVFAIELHENRGERIKEAMPEANVLTPASFFGCSIGWDAFGFAYCNPPFDNDDSYGRVEIKWLSKCAQYLVPNGVILFVCPEPTTTHGRFMDVMTQGFNSVSIIPFPSLYRKHNEVFVIARKNPSWLSKNKAPRLSLLLASNSFLYRPPTSPGPLPYWKKSSLTENEVLEKLATSPLNRHLEVADMRESSRPPLALNNGQIALLLACGELDGIICPEGGEPHVIRGTARKVDEVVDENKVSEKSKTITTTTITERIQMIIRAVDQSGEIHTLS
jgi:hypothetical protein